MSQSHGNIAARAAGIGAEDITAYFARNRQAMIDELQKLVLAESPSTKPEAQQEILASLYGALDALDFRVRILPGRNTGGHLYARPKARRRGQPYQLLLGHCDTVWPLGTLKEMPLKIADGRMTGPGVYDMKAGLVQTLWSLRALRDLALDPSVTPVVVINSDEEIGSRESATTIHRLARRAERAFVMEPSLGQEGKLKTRRKGVGRFTVAVTGKAAHAGLDPESGASAILELSYQIQKLFALNDFDRGVTINVGQIDGGLQPNVIAPASKAVVDVRVPTQADATRVEQAIRGLEPHTPGVSVAVEGFFGRPPLEQTRRNRALWDVAQGCGARLGLSLDEGIAGGGSDGCTTSLYTATLDGLGAVGGGAHAAHEFIYLDSLVERAALLTLLLAAPPNGSQDPAGHPGTAEDLAPLLEGSEP